MKTASSTNGGPETRELQGWVPIDAVVSRGRPGLLWMDMCGSRFDEPFFHQTVARLRSRWPAPDEVFTEFDKVLQFARTVDSVQPAGFIFHSSRCGSTLIANACKTLPGSVVISEADALEKLIARFITDTRDEGKEVLYSLVVRAVMNALGQKRDFDEHGLFVKFSCCSIAGADRLRRIWPLVPRLFLYREPTETIVSNLENKPSWLLDEDRRILASITGATVVEIESMSVEELCARAIGSFYAFGNKLADEGALLLNYSELSAPVISRVLEFFGVDASLPDTGELNRVSETYSKDPDSRKLFTADSAAKRDRASAYISEMVQAWANRPYQELERKRLGFAATGTSPQMQKTL